MNVELIIFVAWFLGGFISGLSGMGAALIAMPVLSLFIPIDILVPASCIVVTAVGICLTIRYGRSCNFSVIPILALSSLPGALVGVGVLVFVPAFVLQLSLGLILVSYVIWQYLYKESEPHKETLPAKCMAGFFAGFTSTALAIAGPPIVIYAIYMKWNQNTTRGTMGVIFLIIYLITMGFQYFAGLYTNQVLTYAVHGIPGAIFGLLMSLPFVKYITVSGFRLLLLAILAVAGLTSMGRAITMM